MKDMKAHWGMSSVRLIKHEIVPKCGSYEVRQCGRLSQYFYWDDDPGRRLDPNTLTSEQAFEKAKAAALRAPDS
jgi:hypothetical protein